MGVLSGLKPEKVFYYFEELCKIPHGSYHTKQISDYLVQFAKERNLECSQDDSNNVVIAKQHPQDTKMHQSLFCRDTVIWSAKKQQIPHTTLKKMAWI